MISRSRNPTQRKIRSPADSALSFESAPVIVVVGEEKRRFHFHINHLISSSEFFKNAMSGDWVKNSSRKIELLEQDADHFSIYANWLYTGRISSLRKSDEYKKDRSVDNSGFEVDNEWTVLAGVYQLGS